MHFSTTLHKLVGGLNPFFSNYVWVVYIGSICLQIGFGSLEHDHFSLGFLYSTSLNQFSLSTIRMPLTLQKAHLSIASSPNHTSYWPTRLEPIARVSSNPCQWLQAALKCSFTYFLREVWLKNWGLICYSHNPSIE